MGPLLLLVRQRYGELEFHGMQSFLWETACIENLDLFEENYLLGCKAIWSVESQPVFWRNTSPSSSG
jgi:hypothetical protein